MFMEDMELHYENDFNVVILSQCLIRKSFIAKYACTYNELVLVS